MMLETPTNTAEKHTAVDKAMSVLRVLGEEDQPAIGVTDMARRTGLSKSTAFRLLGILERNGVVQRVGRDYQLGSLLRDREQDPMWRSRMRLRDLLTPYLIDLYEQCHQTVHLAVLDGTEVLYLNKLHGHRSVRSPSRVDGRAPAYCTSVGKVLLAHDAAAAADTLAVARAAWTSRTIVGALDLEAELARIRNRGVAFDDEEVAEGLSCVATPILGPGRRPLAAISVAGATGHVDTRAHADILRRVSHEATRALLVATARDTHRNRHRAL